MSTELGCRTQRATYALLNPAVRKQNEGMGEDNWKEQVRRSLSDSKVPRRQIADETGIPANRLYTFVSKGHLNYEDARKVEAWLRERHLLRVYIEPPSTTFQPTQGTKPPSDLLAAELRALADILESPDIDKEIKGERFVSAVRGWHNAVDKYARLLQEKKN
jgi:hypothetical protein